MKALGRTWLLALSALMLISAHSFAQSNPVKLNVAVQEFQPVGASEPEAMAITDRLREELVRIGKMTIVDRDKMADILKTQADQQAACSGGPANCAVKIGKILGVRMMISGKVIKFAKDAWQVSATMVDVETAQTVKAETVRYRGDVISLTDKAMPELATKLGG